MAQAEVPARQTQGVSKIRRQAQGHPEQGPRRAATLAAINSYSDPVGFLQKVCRGLLVECRNPDSDDPKAAILTRPTLEQRINAATILSKKVLPDSKAVELGGPDGSDLTINVNTHPHCKGEAE